MPTASTNYCFVTNWSKSEWLKVPAHILPVILWGMSWVRVCWLAQFCSHLAQWGEAEHPLQNRLFTVSPHGVSFSRAFPLSLDFLPMGVTGNPPFFLFYFFSWQLVSMNQLVEAIKLELRLELVVLPQTKSKGDRFMKIWGVNNRCHLFMIQCGDCIVEENVG